MPRVQIGSAAWVRGVNGKRKMVRHRGCIAVVVYNWTGGRPGLSGFAQSSRFTYICKGRELWMSPKLSLCTESGSIDSQIFS
jgi:hypothetical protein